MDQSKSSKTIETRGPNTFPLDGSPTTEKNDSWHSPSPSARQRVVEPTEEDISKCAYEIYLSRGGQDGHDLEDWLAARQLLLHRAEANEAQSASAEFSKTQSRN